MGTLFNGCGQELIALNIDMKNFFDDAPAERHYPKILMQDRWNMSFSGFKIIDVNHVILEISKEDEYIYGELQLTIMVRIEDAEGKIKYLLDMVLSGVFIASPDTEKEDMKSLLSINGCALLYSVAGQLL